ncbi:MAG: hypothetical protein M3Y82_05820 [Verrucomicrobiota bacterium]|nr:hypothetical protein [Verrucomicrobiota bacterium]
MKIPRTSDAIISREKITDYLLNAAHPDNGGKAAFFQELGFTVANWPLFAAALRKVAENFTPANTVESLHGTKYILDGKLETPGGKKPNVRTIWIIDGGSNKPRLVTAYPQNEKEKL